MSRTQSHRSTLPSIVVEDYDGARGAQQTSTPVRDPNPTPTPNPPPTPASSNNLEIFNNINRLLENSLNLNNLTGSTLDPGKANDAMAELYSTQRSQYINPGLEEPYPCVTYPEHISQAPLSSAVQSLFDSAGAGMTTGMPYPEFSLFSSGPLQHWANLPSQVTTSLDSTPPTHSRPIRGGRSPSSDYGSYSSANNSNESLLSPPQSHDVIPKDGTEASQAALINMMNLLSLNEDVSRGTLSMWDPKAQPPPPQQQQQALYPTPDPTLNSGQDVTEQLCRVTGLSGIGGISEICSQTTLPYYVSEAEMSAIDGAARLHRNSAAMSEASCTWSGTLPVRTHRNATYSCMLFLGGVPWDITDTDLQATFSCFGSLKIEWPGKDGYVYLLFDSDKSVRALLQACTHDFSTGEYFIKVSSRRMRSKEVQVIPWVLADSNYAKQSLRKLDSKKTVFVGALHGTITAEGLARIMNDLFGNVIYAGIDTNKYKYPIGSGRVTFSSEKSYMKAVQAAFVKVKTPKFSKKIQIDPYLEDATCSRCNVNQGLYFCRSMSCFRYFCSFCWYTHHAKESVKQHKPLTRNTRIYNVLFP